MHEPVLQEEVREALVLKPGAVAVDLTAGSGGHAVKLLEAVGRLGQVVLLDRDPEAVKRCQERFRGVSEVRIQQAAFHEAGRALKGLGVGGADAVLMDLGVSREQLEDPARGFSFLRDGPLDMRMDPNWPVSAAHMVARSREAELADLIWKYGEERRSRRIARVLVEARRTSPILTTLELAGLVAKAIGRKGRLHPATRVFQALRMAVNDELGQLSTGLQQGFSMLRPGGRLAVIAYHSLEDRTVKLQFKAWRAQGVGRWIFKKPVTPARHEVQRNPSARSAKLRVIERVTA